MRRVSMAWKIILDTTALIAFYTELQRPDLLKSLIDFGYELIIPRAVYEELKPDRNFKQIDCDVKEGIILVLDKVPESELMLLRFRFPSLHDGELEVIWWGLKFHSEGENYFCVLDDKTARKGASRFGLRIKGTIGILNLLNELEVITKEQKRELCLRLVGSGFWFPSEWCY